MSNSVISWKRPSNKWIFFNANFIRPVGGRIKNRPVIFGKIKIVDLQVERWNIIPGCILFSGPCLFWCSDIKKNIYLVFALNSRCVRGYTGLPEGCVFK